MELIPNPPEAVRWISSTLEKAGFNTWVVGGAIRNLLLGLPAGDWDLATRANPEDIMTIFPRTVPIGIDHGTVGVLDKNGTLYEVTTFRRDIKTFGRRAIVEFSETIEEDLLRRDFTFNSIAWHPLTGDFLDPNNGILDIENCTLQTVGSPAERFSEDFLRVLRALRFSGQFGFTIDEETWEALCHSVSELHVLSAERIQEELMKILSKSEKPSESLQLYASSGVIKKLYPELLGDVATEDFSFLNKTFIACDIESSDLPLVRLAILLSPIALGRSGEASEVRDIVVQLLSRLRFSNAEIKHVSTLVSNRTMGIPHEESLDIRYWLYRTGPTFFPDLARIWLAEMSAGIDPSGSYDSLSVNSVEKCIEAIKDVLKNKPPLAISDLAFNGDHLQDLGVNPGPMFGDILNYLLEHVIEYPEANTKANLEELVLKSDFLSEVIKIDHENHE